MKIERDPALTPAQTAANQALQAGRTTGRRTEGADSDTSSKAAPAATVELSSRSRELHQALRAANAAPDVRQDVVDRVRAQVKSGTYHVDAAAIARRIIDREA